MQGLGKREINKTGVKHFSKRLVGIQGALQIFFPDSSQQTFMISLTLYTVSA